MDILRTRKGRVAAFATASTLAFSGVAAPAATAAPPVIIGGGLVNVVVTDVIDDVTVTVQDVNVGIGVAAGIAAQVCGVTAQVGVVAQQLARTGQFSCEQNPGDQAVTIDQQ